MLINRPGQLPEYDREQFYAGLTLELLQRIENAPVKLEFAPYAGQLIQMALRAWFEETPTLEREASLADLRQLAIEIFERTVRNPLVINEMEKVGRVSFGTLLVSAGLSSRDILIAEGFCRGEEPASRDG